jgi:mono/diheme cytochrome c family protein
VAIVGDVYSGWPEAKRGAVKYLRIAQKVPWPCVPDETKACGFNDLHWMPAAWEHVLGLWDWGHARVIGTVPVEADGSAHFKVPADQTVYFQALDENFVEVRRMRSNVTFPAGETRACIGCHESQAVAPPAQRSITTLALRRAPSNPEPPAWGDRVVPDYERDIQPIFERHCLGCHGEKEPKGGLEFTARRIDGYLQSYRTLFGLKPTEPTPFTRGYWNTWHPGEPAKSDAEYAAAKTTLRNMMNPPAPAQLVSIADYFGGAEVTQLEQFGSSRSRLIQVLLRDAEHRREVRMNRADWVALVTWVDLNAQYWGTFVEKDGHFAAKRRGAQGEALPPPRRVRVEFPDPWRQPPAGQWYWRDEHTVAVRP